MTWGEKIEKKFNDKEKEGIKGSYTNRGIQS